MKKVYVFLADGFEDVEALIPVDVLRRGGVDVTTVSISDFPLVTSAHGVNIEADIMFEQGDFSDADLVFLPGGMPGAKNLFEHKGVCKAVVDQFAAGRKVAAICAAHFLKARKLPAILVSSRCLMVPPILPTSLPSMATSPRLKVLLLPSPSPTSS